jgi:hypothetical protein
MEKARGCEEDGEDGRKGQMKTKKEAVATFVNVY